MRRKSVRAINWIGFGAAQLLIVAGVYAQVATAPNTDLTRRGPAAVTDGHGNVLHENAQNSPVTAQEQEEERQQTEASVYQQTGSLFKASLAGEPASDSHQSRLQSASLFAVPEPKPRTIKKHDLVTVIINEEASVASDAKSSTNRDTQLNATLSSYLQINPTNLKNFSFTGVQPTVPPGFVGDLQRNFKGDGQDDRTDSFTTRLSAEVVDVKPNGTLVLEAKRNIQVNSEIQHYLLSGICRAEDVTPDNTILSTQLSDLDLRREDQGMVRDATKQGGLNKLLDFINPF